MTDSVDARRGYDPVALQDGCPVGFVVDPATSAYFKLGGFNETSASGALPSFFLEWDMSNNDQTLPMFFSFRNIPRYYEGALTTFFDWYMWSTVTADVASYPEDDSGLGFDFYHCIACGGLVSSCQACYEPDLRTTCDHTFNCLPTSGDLYMTIYSLNTPPRRGPWPCPRSSCTTTSARAS